MWTFEALSAEHPDTPAGRASAFVLHNISTAGTKLDAAMIDQYYGPAADAESGRGRAQHLAQRYRNGFASLGAAFEIVTVAGDERTVRARLRGSDGREWLWSVTVNDGAPAYILGVDLRAAPPQGVEVRMAEPGDNDALRDICREAVLRLDGRTVAIVPGPDYFAQTRLMGGADVYVALVGGEPAAVECGVSYEVRLGGRPARLYLVAHSRVRPAYAKTQVWRALHTQLANRHYQVGSYNVSSLAYARPDNRAAQRISGMQSRWSVRAYRAVIDCAELATEAAGDEVRPATPDDVDRIVAMVNHAHGREQLFVPYTADSLTERLQRAPDLYTWSDVWLNDHAVVGVWDSGEEHVITHVETGTVVRSRRAAVLDYGWDPDHDDDLANLLRAWSRHLVRRGVTHLGVFSSDPSPSAPVLKALTTEREEYDVAPPYIREPPGLAASGVYVDPVYF